MKRELTFMLMPDGKIPDGIKQNLITILPDFKGKKIRMTIEEAKERRSLDQNSYYRGVILPHVRKAMAEEGDMRSLDDWHECLLASFSPMSKVTNMKGADSLAPQRTHKMNVEEMGKFITAITAEMAMRNYPVPISETSYYKTI